MQATLQRLIDVYRREREIYGRIRAEVSQHRQLIEAGRPYREINEALTAKRDLLGEIERLEAGVRREQELWRRHRHALDGREATTLMRLLAEVTALVEEILAAERENEVLLTSRRRLGPRPVVSRERALATYRFQSGAEVER
ncbi:MAG: hypothetical protein JW819_01045 [Candidatus Krumholzibacteriota bacterium]|nr:hypothetical protein [Candidatus Krumholzibacteriota bacterium]